MNLNISELSMPAWARADSTTLRQRFTPVRALMLGLTLALVVIAVLGYVASAQTSRLTTSRQRATALTGTLGETQSALARTKTDLVSARDDLATTKEDLADTRRRLTAATNKLAHVSTQLTGAREQLSTTQGELSNTRGELSNTRGTLSDTQDELSDTQADSARKSAVIRDLNVCLDGVLSSAIALAEGDPYTALDELDAVDRICRSSIDESRELGVLS